MKKLAMLMLTTTVLVGCVSTYLNKTFQSQGETFSPTSNFQWALIKTQFNMKDQTTSQVAIVNAVSLRIGDLENVIQGSLLKKGISVVSSAEFQKLNEEQRAKCFVVEWGVSGRNARGNRGAYSQEVTVLIKKVDSGDIVYKGIGEYLGQTEIDDLRGALLAALKNFTK